MKGQFYICSSSKEEARHLEPLFKKWAELNDRYVSSFSGLSSDLPFWYTERANTGILAAAAWQCCEDSISLEEYSCGKGNKISGGNPGRIDLYLRLDKEKEFVCELKFDWAWISDGLADMASQAKESIDSAEEQLGNYNRKETEDFNWLSGIFMVVMIHKNDCKIGVVEDIKEFFSNLCSTDPDVYGMDIISAYQAPIEKVLEVHANGVSEDTNLYPGVLFFGKVTT